MFKFVNWLIAKLRPRPMVLPIVLEVVPEPVAEVAEEIIAPDIAPEPLVELALPEKEVEFPVINLRGRQPANTERKSMRGHLVTHYKVTRVNGDIERGTIQHG